MSVLLTAGAARAVLLPSRGGLLSELELARKDGSQQKILWLPSDFAPEGDSWPGGGAPLLFPFAGRVFHQEQPFRYALQEQVFAMPLHGFAHNMAWQILASGPSHALLQLEATAKTRIAYPYDFVLRAHYQLTPQQLNLAIEVQHLGQHQQPMPVALGWHPYFCVAATGSVPHLKTYARQEIPVLSNGAAGQVQSLDAKRNGPITQPGLANLILAELGEAQASLIDPISDDSISITWSPKELCRYLVLWSRDPATFFCVEPWMGLPDAVNNGQGVVWLDAGKSLSLRLAITNTN